MSTRLTLKMKIDVKKERSKTTDLSRWTANGSIYFNICKHSDGGRPQLEKT